MKYYLIGFGRIGRKHLEAALLNKIININIIDIIEERVEESKSYINESVTSNYLNSDIVNNDFEIKIAAICTPSNTHLNLASEYLNNNHHVIIEKPIGLDLKQLDQIIAIADKVNLKTTVCHQNRFNLSVKRLRKSIQEKHFGRLYYGVAAVRWSRNTDYYSSAFWRGKWESDGGALMNQSIHNIDLLMWMMGSPVIEVFGYIDNKKHPSIDVEDMGVALLKFANGSYGIIESSMNTYPENFEETLSIFGEKGTVVLGGKSVNKIIHWNVKDDSIEDLEKFNEEVDSVYGNGHIALYKDFIEAIEQDREPAITLHDGRNAVEVILAIYLSSFEKRPVQLPLPADTSTIMFEGKSFK